MVVPIHDLATPLRVGDLVYSARVMGRRRAEDGRWEGWIEFTLSDGTATLASGRETVQSTLQALRYWATGLEPTYLDGALARAIVLALRAA
jgi:hypothetical protein